ncbi:MAG: hypothetical protein RPU72_11905 [Candidatus Sedimenticola sp. (ex Thyasira tokunagai)]
MSQNLSRGSDTLAIGFEHDGACYVRSYYNGLLYINPNYQYLWNKKVNSDNWVRYTESSYLSTYSVKITDANQVYKDSFTLCRANNIHRTIGYITAYNKCKVMGYQNLTPYWESDFSILDAKE